MALLIGDLMIFEYEAGGTYFEAEEDEMKAATTASSAGGSCSI